MPFQVAQLLTLAQIESMFDSEWVLVENPETTDQLDIKGGEVRFHSKDRDEVYRAVNELCPKRFAVVYAG